MRIYFLLIAFLCSLQMNAQKSIDKQITTSYANKTLTEIFYDIENSYQVKIYFDVNTIPTFRVTRDYKDKQIWSIVNELLNGTRLKSLSYKSDALVVIDLQKINKTEIESLVEKWDMGKMDFPRKNEIVELKRSYGSPNEDSKEVRYSMQITDKSTGEPLIGALVYSKNFEISEITDENGMTELNIASGIYNLNLTYTSYQTIDLTLEIYEDGNEEFKMKPSVYLLDEIEIVANSGKAKMEDSKSGIERIDMVKVESIPQALGESDLLKSLEVLPGVTTAGEISSGFNVRGGKLDASLVLLDDAIIFNPTHVVGFISAFNTDMIKSATLYKGYVDSEFGNRSSAVLDISSDKGGQKWKLKGGIGTSMMKLMVQGPISKRTTFAASARGSFSDYLLNLVANNEVQNSSANFYDLNLALEHHFSDKTSLSFSSYASDDYFLYNEDFGFEWQNKFASTTARHNWNGNLSSKLGVSMGSYSTNQFTINASDAFNYTNGIKYLKVIQSNTLSLGENHYIKGGIEVIKYNLDPEELSPNGDMSTIQDTSVQRLGSISMAPFISGKFSVLKKLTFEGGLRYTTYRAIGPGFSYNYENDIVTSNTISNVSEVGGNESVSSFALLEPRASFSFLFRENWSLKGSYNKISQNAQLVTIANTSIPTDLWIFSNDYIKPRIVNQFSFGVFHNSKGGKYSFSLEAFKKNTDNNFVLKDFPEIISNDHLETEVSEAVGKSMGLELYAEKTQGKFTGSLAYTLSKTQFRTTTDRFSVNFGNWTDSDIDIPHQVNLVFSYKLTPTFIFTGGYTYKSGRPFTVPEGTAIVDGFVIPIYSQRNLKRLPSYKRFDLAVTLDLRKRTQGGFRNSFTFGLYNFFGNNNVNNVFFRKSVGGNIKGFQLSVIGAVVPSISWNFVLD